MTSAMLYKSIAQNIFSRKELFEAAKRIDSDFKKTQLKFYIGKLKAENLIFSIGHNLYAKEILDKKIYAPIKSETVEKIASVMKEGYPLVSFRVWDLSCLNEFVNHLLAHNHIFLEVEKDGMEFIYERMHVLFPKKVLLNPTKKEIEIYSAPDDIIITPLTTECPAGNNSEYEISVEKLVVDMFSNKVLQCFLSKGDYVQILEEMFEKYNISESKLFRYARRRNKAREIYDFLCEKTNVKLMTEVRL